MTQSDFCCLECVGVIEVNELEDLIGLGFISGATILHPRGRGVRGERKEEQLALFWTSVRV
jgi:hypothetical protein